MTPEISEFSYGFALTNEIVGWVQVTAAPLFPSLIEEGKAGGGYDVKLDIPAVPLYLQFKRADCMTRRSAREIHTHNLPLSLPFHRFSITESSKSDQLTATHGSGSTMDRYSFIVSDLHRLLVARSPGALRKILYVIVTDGAPRTAQDFACGEGGVVGTHA